MNNAPQGSLLIPIDRSYLYLRSYNILKYIITLILVIWGIVIANAP